jgi:alanyl-tRNA synthetase
MGGQVGDSGVLENANEKIVVIDTKRENNLPVHILNELPENPAATFVAKINKENRAASEANHTATHLLHEALRDLLGTHVEQKGSFVSPKVLRFDFSHFQKLTREEIVAVEKAVNKKIRQNVSLVEHREMPIDEAKKLGAMALFGEKYGDEVRVVSMGDYSIELCGGTHLTNTSQIGMFKILSEGGVAAGVRRIEAITGRAVYNFLKEKEEVISNVCTSLKTKEDGLTQKVTSIIEENKSLSKELHDMKTKMSLQAVDSVLDSKVDVNGVNLVTTKFEGMDMNTIIFSSSAGANNRGAIGDITEEEIAVAAAKGWTVSFA